MVGAFADLAGTKPGLDVESLGARVLDTVTNCVSFPGLAVMSLMGRTGGD
jgi:hypothetical protein